jgi:hypothetical protein
MTQDLVLAALNAANAAAAHTTSVVLPPAPPGFETVVDATSPLGYTFRPIQLVVQQPAVNQVAAYNAATAVASPIRAAGRKLTMNTIQEERGTLATDYYISVDENGIKVKFSDEDPNAALSNKLITNLTGFIDFGSLAFGYGLRYEDHKGDLFYSRSYDGVVTQEGTAWETAIAQAKSADPSNKGEYPFVDVIVELTKPAVSIDGFTILPAGVKVGFSTSPTVWKVWQAFYFLCLKQGLITENAHGHPSGEVDLILGFISKSKGKNTWGVYKFDLLPDEAPVVQVQPVVAPVEAPVADTTAEQPAAAPRRRAAAPAAQ